MSTPTPAVPDEYVVLDYDGAVLPGSWPTQEEAVDKGLCSRYLLSGYEVVRTDFGSGDEPCEACNYDRHTCPGCGTNVEHGTVACDQCEAALSAKEARDA